MNIIQMRREERLNNIKQIIDSIAKAKEEGKEISEKDIIMATMANLGISKRTAKEYVDVAIFKLK